MVWIERKCAGLLLVFAAMQPLAGGAQEAGPADIVLHGTIDGSKYQKHETLRFTVPVGIERMTVDLVSPGFAKGMYLTAGLWDPQRYRGEGRSTFTLSSVDATGPYLQGPIVPGEWRIAIGFNYVAPAAKGEYTVTVHLSRLLDPEHYPVLNPKAGWYKGDLHAHTGRTDAMCRSQSGANVPCPPSRLFAAAAAQGLDFLAVTDHNTQATFNEMMQDQLYYDRMLLIAMKTGLVAGSKLRLLVDGNDVAGIPALQPDGANRMTEYVWVSDGGWHWIRAELDDATGQALTLTNPIYVNWQQ